MMAATRNYWPFTKHRRTEDAFRLASTEQGPQMGDGRSRSAREEAPPRHSGWPLFVVFTTVQDTLLSLQAVDQLTSDLATSIHLLIPDRADNSPTLITPLMLAEFTARYFLSLIPHTRDFKIKLIRYPAATEDLWEVIPPQSLIVLTGVARRFRLSAEQRFARQLQQAGHEVIFFPAQSLTTGSFVPFKVEREPDKGKPLDRWKSWFLRSRSSQN